MEFHYLLYDEHADRVRYGWTNGPFSRLKTHKLNGFTKVLMLRPGSYAEEGQHHSIFQSNGWSVGYDKSTYKAVPELFNWATALIVRRYATNDPDDVATLPSLPFEVWKFGADLRYSDEHGQFTLLDGVPWRERPQYASEWFPILNSLGDDWLTPPRVLDIARAALGGFDLDPASCCEANEDVKAAIWYGKEQDGLSANLPWRGRVWCNPPYGRGDNSASAFVRRLVNEYLVENVTEAITCLNLNSMCSLWFKPLEDAASAHAIWRGRLDFRPPASKKFTPKDSKKTKHSSPTKGTVFSYLGKRPEAFIKAFEEKCMILKPSTTAEQLILIPEDVLCEK